MLPPSASLLMFKVPPATITWPLKVLSAPVINAFCPNDFVIPPVPLMRPVIVVLFPVPTAAIVSRLLPKSTLFAVIVRVLPVVQDRAPLRMISALTVMPPPEPEFSRMPLVPMVRVFVPAPPLLMVIGELTSLPTENPKTARAASKVWVPLATAMPTPLPAP